MSLKISCVEKCASISKNATKKFRKTGQPIDWGDQFGEAMGL